MPLEIKAIVISTLIVIVCALFVVACGLTIRELWKVHEAQRQLFRKRFGKEDVHQADIKERKSKV